MKYKELEYDSILEMLKEKRILKIKYQEEKDKFKLTEMCDRYFLLKLHPMNFGNLGMKLSVWRGKENEYQKR